MDFTFGNYGPFKDDVTLSMQATTATEHKGNVFTADGAKEQILSSAIIFGPNASGKTYVTKAIGALKDVVSKIDDSSGIPFDYNPYRMTKDSSTAPVRMRIRMILDGTLYDYNVEYLERTIVNESLHYYPKTHRARIFERYDTINFNAAKKTPLNMTTASVTYLAMASVSADPICSLVRRAILQDIIVLSSDLDSLVKDSCGFACSDPDRKGKAIAALNTADFGISDFSYNETNNNPIDIKKHIFIKHDYKDPDLDESGLTIPMNLESSGTSSMFGLVSPLIDALENGKLIIMDELGAHLHPMLTRWIVEQFSGDNNPNGAQLIANTHDVSLMDINELLRRDQIWFVNKNYDNGCSDLYCLSEYNVRKDANILKKYIMGRFDAVPVVRHRGVIQ